MENMNIANIADGALVERADEEIKKVLENIMDPNTPSKAKRKVTITLVFEPKEDIRDMSEVTFSVKSQLAPAKAISTSIAFEKDGNNIVVEEFVKGSLRGQTKIDHETGEIIEPKVASRKIGINN